MKHHNRKQAYDLASAALSLSEALLCLRTPAEIKLFLEDLCTPAEIEALVVRWRVAQLLEKGLSYREVRELSEVSVTTVGRVARFMGMGAGGYRLALDRLQGKEK
jgi:TrpR-related protein YerC/YecD